MVSLINAHRILCQEAAIRLEHEGADERYSSLASAIQDIEKYVKGIIKEGGDFNLLDVDDYRNTLNAMHGIRHAWLPSTEGRPGWSERTDV